METPTVDLCTVLSAKRTFHDGSMWITIVVLLVIWAILGVVGFVFEGLFWLTVVAGILFLGTLLVGIIRQRTKVHA